MLRNLPLALTHDQEVKHRIPRDVNFIDWLYSPEGTGSSAVTARRYERVEIWKEPEGNEGWGRRGTYRVARVSGGRGVLQMPERIWRRKLLGRMENPQLGKSKKGLFQRGNQSGNKPSI